MQRSATALVTGLALLWSGAEVQAEFPAKPITLIVPYAAGGSNDTLSRIIAEHMSRTFGQSVVIENDAGAAGTTPAARTARAAPNGYTILMGNMGTHGVAPAYYPALKYDPTKDFTPIGLAAEVPAVLVVRNNFPASNLREFIDYVRKHQDRLNEAHVGVGSPTHTFCTLLQSIMGTKTGRIPYRGGAQAINDLIGGQVDFSCISLSGVVTHIQSGTIKAITIASPQRAELIKDVPTAIEGGFPEFIASTWNGLFAPKGLPSDIQTKLNDALGKALDDEQTHKRLLELGFVIPPKANRSPEALRQLVESEVTRWTKVVKSAQVGTD